MSYCRDPRNFLMNDIAEFQVDVVYTINCIFFIYSLFIAVATELQNSSEKNRGCEVSD